MRAQGQSVAVLNSSGNTALKPNKASHRLAGSRPASYNQPEREIKKRVTEF
jgi:hypothetical protein